MKANLKVLLGGGRKWFLPKNVTGNGSVRATTSDYVLPAELATGWGLNGAAVGSLDPNRDLIADFEAAGFTYAPDGATLDSVPADTDKLLGLFSLSNMNVAKDKIDGRRGVVPTVSPTGQTVVEDYGFPDQPMLDEMTDKALQVLNRNPRGFVLLIEGASIDKQAHQLDSERWIEDAIEFDYAVEKVRQFVNANPDTLALVLADQPNAAASTSLVPSTVTDATLQAKIAAGNGSTTNGTPPSAIRWSATPTRPAFPAYALAVAGRLSGHDGH